MTKKEIRSEMKRREAEFLAGGLAAGPDPLGPCGEAARIWARVEASPEFIRARTVLAYMDIPGEVPARAFLERWAGRKRIIIPRVEGTDLALFEYDPKHLREGYRGILEPSDDAVPAIPGEIDLALVPGVAFAFMDGRLWRMGRGKGFYDRLLPCLDCPKAGVFFSFRLLPSLPLDPWDEPLDLGFLP